MRTLELPPPGLARPVGIVVLLVAATALFSSTFFGRSSHRYQAGLLDASMGRVPQAIANLEAFVAAGRLYAQLQRCLEARRHFEAAARGPKPVEPWASRARQGLMTCPDFFPTGLGKSWVYGDSASSGRAMRLEWKGEPSGLTSTLYAGQKKLREDKLAYEVSDWTVWQTDSEGRFPLLKYPYAEGRAWKAQRGARSVTYAIDSVDATAKTAAGVFHGCLKVRESTAGVPDAWRYDYYCPFVGRALTTVAGPGFENPNTELLEYR
jgi:hypothetical protein